MAIGISSTPDAPRVIPARYFESNRTFSELAALAALGELEGAFDPSRVFEIAVAEPNTYVGVLIDGPLSALCMWGLTYTDGYPSQRMTIDTHPDDAYVRRGRVIDRTLAGDRVVFEVLTPSVDAATELLVAYLGRRDRK